MGVFEKHICSEQSGEKGHGKDYDQEPDGHSG